MLSLEILYTLLRTTLFLTISGGLCFIALCKVERQMPKLTRLLWLGVLLTGWFWFRPVVEIPYKNSGDVPVPRQEQTVTGTRTASPILTPLLTPLDGERPHETLPQPAMPVAVIQRDVAETQAVEGKSLLFKIIFAVWIGGMAIAIFLAAAGYARILLLLRKTVPAGDDLTEPWRCLLEASGMDARKIPMLVSDGATPFGPALIRTFWGYRLVVPQNLWSELSESGKSGILKHELAHFRRRDVWKSLFVRILVLPHWFNPLARLAVRRFEELAELLCDRAAFDKEKSGAVEFAETLLLLHDNTRSPFVVRTSIFGTGPRNCVKSRVDNLLNTHFQTRISTMKKILLLTCAAMIFAAFLFRVEFVQKSVAQATDTKNEPQVASPVTETSQQVELRLKIIDHETQEPQPGTKIRLEYGYENQYAHEWETGPDGVGVTKIPLAAANSGNQVYFRTKEKDMFQAASLWNIPKDWNPGKPLEITLELWRKPRVVTGTVVDSQGQPVADAWVSGEWENPFLWTKTDSEGRFERYRFDHNYMSDISPLYAVKDGVGAYAMNAPMFNKDQKDPGDGPFTLKLSKGKPISVRVVDDEGNPLEGISVAPSHFSTDYRYTKEVWSWNTSGIKNFWRKKTDVKGMVTFDSLPTEGYDMATFNAWGTDPRFDKDKKTSRYGNGRAVWRSRANNDEITIQLPKKIMLEGSVQNADGSPPPGSMQISVVSHRGWASVGTETDYAGNFTIFTNANDVLSVQPIYDVHNNPGIGVAAAQLNVDVGNGWSEPAPRFDFVLEKGTKVLGKIIADKPEKPFQQMYVQVFDVRFDRKIGAAEMSKRFVLVNINEQGEFDMRLPDGVYRFKVGDKEILGVLEIKGEEEKRFDLKM